MTELDIAFRLLLSIALGALIGVEREFYRKPAGFRTNCLICLGSALFTIISIELDRTRGDPGRIAAQIVTGVGFLGAGAILRHEGRVIGLTTAAGIWMVASLGMAVGAGHYLAGIMTALVGLGVLRLFDFVERWIERLAVLRTYEIRVAEPADLEAVDRAVQECGVRIRRRKQMRLAGGVVGIWSTQGREQNQEALVQRLLGEPAVTEFTW